MYAEPTINWNAPTNRQINDVTVKPSAAVLDARYDGSATEKQIRFARSLAQQLGLTEKLETELAKGLGPSKARASALIDRLIQLRDSTPTKPAPSAPVSGLDLSGLNGGYYAATVDGVTKFFRVDKPTEGKWSGWTFVKIQASDDLHRVGRQAPGQSYSGGCPEYLTAIVADEQAAYALYGTELGRCGVCGRTLTDETSRKLGIGPVCAEKLGY